MIYLDVSTAVHSRAGLGRYAEKLAAAVAVKRPRQVALFYNRRGAGRLPASLTGLPARRVEAGFKPWRLAVLLAHLAGFGFNRLVPDAHLFHSTEHLLFPLHRVPVVLTVHDLIFRLFPEYHKRLNYWYLNLAMPLYCRRAAAIIAVSEATRQDLVTQYGIDPAKVHVVYEAASDRFQPPTPADIAAARNKYRLPARYLVHLGTIEPRKNLDRLVDALLRLRIDHSDLALVLVGAKGWLYEPFLARLAREGLEEAVRLPGWIEDEDLPAVIGGAALAVQPSLYEGFGLPLLEHMACGQVVAASGRSSLPEIGAGAAAYFSPEDTVEMAAVIDRLLTNEDEYRQRRAQGLARAATFSWNRAARETIAVYDQLLERQATFSAGS